MRNTKFSRGPRRGRPDGNMLKVLGATIAALCLSMVGALYLHMSSAPSDARVSSEVDILSASRADIIVPIETLQVGTSFQPTMFRKEPKPEDQITPEMIRSFDELKGLYAKAVLIKNQPIVRTALTNRQPVHILTAMLPKRYRAVALEVQKPLLDNVDGWAQPGTVVDVVWLTDVFGKETASVLAGPVKVLAANKTTEGAPVQPVATNNLVTVTLLLSLEDALRVSLASMHGKISLGLRGQGDTKPNESAQPISSVTTENIPMVPQKPVIQVVVGDPISHQRETFEFDLSGRRIEQQ